MLTWDGYPVPKVVERDGKRVEIYPNARQPIWPESDFIVGNPPFSGARQIRARIGSSYVDALREFYRWVPETSDYVLYWWDRAAALVECEKVRRFGLITTNSVTQRYSRALIRSHLEKAKHPVRLIFAIADHPWSEATDGAAVRVAMTVVGSSADKGLARIGKCVDAAASQISVHNVSGISEALKEAGNVGQTRPLKANADMCFQGVVPAGDGFKLTPELLMRLGIEKSAVKPYLIGQDIVQRHREKFVIDFFGYDEASARDLFPHAFSRILETVALERRKNSRKSYRDLWWIFAEPRPAMRKALTGLERFIGIPYTSKHRLFCFVESKFLPDAMLYACASDDAALLAMLSSRVHVSWSLNQGGTLEDRPRYNKADTFDPFPFPIGTKLGELKEAGEKLDAHRKRALAHHADLTLTELYNVLEKVKIGTPLTDKEENIKQRGLVLILKELHDEIDRLTADAYGWPHDLSDEEILTRLVALNAERAKEEAAGHVRWLRPEYQIPRFGKKVRDAALGKTGELDLAETVVPIDAGLPAFPTDAGEATLAIEAVLAAAATPITAAEIARGFKRGGKRIEQKVARGLASLVLYGRIAAVAEDRFAARRAA